MIFLKNVFSQVKSTMWFFSILGWIGIIRRRWGPMFRFNGKNSSLQLSSKRSPETGMSKYLVQFASNLFDLIQLEFKCRRCATIGWISSLKSKTLSVDCEMANQLISYLQFKMHFLQPSVFCSEHVNNTAKIVSKCIFCWVSVPVIGQFASTFYIIRCLQLYLAVFVK